MVPILIGITIITFAAMHFAPGNPASLATDMNLKASSQTHERLVKLYGLDKPWYKQYFSWLKRVAKLDFGDSFKDGRPAIKKIFERLPASLLLNFLSLFLIFAIAIPIGVISAIKRNTLTDKALTFFVFIGYAMPAFWFALLLMLLFGLKLGWLPISGLHSINYSDLNFIDKVLDVSKHLILPVCASALTGMASLARYTRTSMIEALSQNFIKTAYAKGLSENKIIFRHALRNALLPIITIAGLSLPALIGGGFIFETIFAYPGMGRLGFEAIMARDYPVIMATATIAAFLTLIGNLLADISYFIADPRIRHGGK